MQTGKAVENSRDIALERILALAAHLLGAQRGTIRDLDGRESAWGPARPARAGNGRSAGAEPVTTRSWPVTGGDGDAGGALTLVWDGPAAVSEEEERIAAAVARAAGATLEFRRRLRALAAPFIEDGPQRRRSQAAVSAFVQRSLFDGGAEPLLEDAALLAAELLGASIVQVFEAGSDGRRLRMRGGYGLPPDLRGRASVGSGRGSLAGLVLERGEPLVSSDLTVESRFRASALVREHGGVCAAAVPVGGPRRRRGALVAYWSRHRHVRTGEIHFLQNLSAVIAAALGQQETRAEFCAHLESHPAGNGDVTSARADGCETVWHYIPAEDGARSGLAFAALPHRSGQAAAVAVGRRRGSPVPAALANVLGFPAGTTVVPAGSEPRLEELLGALRQGELWHAEVGGRQEGGRLRWLRVTAIPAAWFPPPRQRHLLLVSNVTQERWVSGVIQELESRRRPVAPGTAVAVALVNASGEVIAANSEWERRRERAGCGSVWSIGEGAEGASRLCSHPACAAYAPHLRSILGQVARGHRPAYEGDYRCSSFGLTRWFAVRIEPAGCDDEGVPHATFAEWDITPQRQAEEEQRRNEARALAVLHSAWDAILTVNHRGIIESANPAASRMFGLAEPDLVGRRLGQILPAPGERGHDPALSRAVEDELGQLCGPEREARGRHADGGTFPISLIVTELSIGPRPIYTAVIRDLSERKRTEDRIERLIYHDEPTALPNRLLFRDRLDFGLSQARRTGQMLAVLFLDVDRFQRINESLGHVAGDRLLSAVARRIEEALPPHALLARWGGDEFNVLLPKVRAPEDAIAVANRVRAAIRRPFEIEGGQVYATLSIGLSVYPYDGQDAETLIRHADISMHRAKRQGGDASLAFVPEMHRAAAARASLDAELHRAVERDEFAVYFQPQVELAGGRIIGAECLVRWQHPRRGLLAPQSFIPLAERTGLIVPLGFCVLRTACRQIAIWQQLVPDPFRVAVNLSLRQVREPGLVAGLEALLRETEIRPEWLDLEITESVAMNAAPSRLRVLRQLKALGVRMSLDDFGKGYSSLRHLRRLPIETVKIDRSFVRRIRRDPRDATIARAVIQLGHALGLRVVAEGVTSPEEAAYLRDQGCDLAQGYLYGRPMPIEQFNELLGLPVASGDGSAAAQVA